MNKNSLSNKKYFMANLCYRSIGEDLDKGSEPVLK